MKPQYEMIELMPSTFSDFSTDLLRGLRVGDSIHVHRRDKNTDIAIKVAAKRLKIETKQKTLMVIDPVTMSVEQILVVTKTKGKYYAPKPEIDGRVIKVAPIKE